MGIESPVHLLFLAVVALLVLGPKRLPELARSLGRSIRELREAMNDEPRVGPAEHSTNGDHAAAAERDGAAAGRET